MKKIFSILLIFVLLTSPVFARGHHHGPAPRIHHGPPHHVHYVPSTHHHHHHHSGPSRGWYNGALITFGILEGLSLINDIVSPEPVQIERTVYVPAQPVQPQSVVVQQPMPQPVIIQAPAPVQPVVVQPSVVQPTPVYVQPSNVQYLQAPVVTPVPAY